MTTWAHLTELFSSLPWFKMRDPRGVARKIYGVARCAPAGFAAHKNFVVVDLFFGHGPSFVYMFSLCAAIAAVSVRAGEAERSAAAAAPSTSTHVRRARSPVLLSFEISYILAVSTSDVFRVLPRTSSPSAGGCILGSGSGGRDAELARRGRSRRACKAWPYTDRDLGQGQSPYSSPPHLPFRLALRRTSNAQRGELRR